LTQNFAQAMPVWASPTTTIFLPARFMVTAS
jgi:hypothetical protein